MPKIKITKTVVTEPNGKELTQDQRNVWSDFAEAHPNLNFDQKFELFTKVTPKSGIDKDVLKNELAQYAFHVNQAESKRTGLQEPLAINKSAFGEKQLVNTGDSFLKVFDEKGKLLGRHNKYGELEGAVESIPGVLVAKQDIPLDIDPESIFMQGEKYVGYKDPQSGDITYTRFEDLTKIPKFYPKTRQLTQQKFAEQLAKRKAKDEEYRISEGLKTANLPSGAAIKKK